MANENDPDARKLVVYRITTGNTSQDYTGVEFDAPDDATEEELAEAAAAAVAEHLSYGWERVEV